MDRSHYISRCSWRQISTICDAFRQVGEQAAKLSSASEPVFGTIRSMTNRALGGLVEAARDHLRQSGRSKKDPDFVKIEVPQGGYPYDEVDDDDKDDKDWQIISVFEKIDAQVATKPTIQLGNDWMVCSLDEDGSVSVIKHDGPSSEPPEAPPQVVPSPASSADLWRSIETELCQVHPPMHTVAKLMEFLRLRDNENRFAGQNFQEHSGDDDDDAPNADRTSAADEEQIPISHVPRAKAYNPCSTGNHRTCC